MIASTGTNDNLKALYPVKNNGLHLFVHLILNIPEESLRSNLSLMKNVRILIEITLRFLFNQQNFSECSRMESNEICNKSGRKNIFWGNLFARALL